VTPRHAGGGTGPGALVRLAAAVAALLAASTVVSPVASGASTGGPSIPLATAAADSTGAQWAIVAMGHLSDPANTFWQLLYRASGGRWELRTPPGVADNGGLVAAPGAVPGTLTSGFVPTAELTFSPLASTADAGATWSTGSVLPFGLEDVPDALSGPSPSSLWALVTGGRSTAPLPAGGAVVSGGTVSGRWRAIVTRTSLARSAAGRRCGLQALTAVALTGPSAGVLGAACTATGIVGLFSVGQGRWRLVGPRLRAGAVTVLRLVVVGTAADVLLAVRLRGSTRLVAAWGHTTGGPWRLSPELAAPASGALCSSSTTAAGGFVVLVRTSTGCRTLVANPATASWRQLPDPPALTAVVVAGPGTLDALTVRSTVFSDFRLTSGGTWRLAQTINVPIQFGSSS